MRTKVEESTQKSRKGIEFKVVVDYFILFAVAFIVLILLQDTGFIASHTIFLEVDKNLWLDALSITFIALAVDFIIRNLFINLTLWDTDNSQPIQAIIFGVSFAIAMIVGFKMGILTGQMNTLTILFITLVALIKHIKLTILIPIHAIVALSIVFFIADGYSYGVSFKGGIQHIVLFVTFLFMAQTIFVHYMQHRIVNMVVRGFNQLSKLIPKTLILSTLVLFSFAFTYGIGIFIAQQLGYLEVLSVKEVILIFIAYQLVGSDFTLSLSHIHTKSFTQRTTNHYV